jgi:glycosyltransferase involved in cell wall biosynthesis
MKKVVLLVVGSDMYGLSRVALQLVERLQGEYSVEVWASEDGPLLQAVRERGAAGRVMPLPVLRRQEVLSARLPLTALRLCWSALRLWLRSARSHGGIQLVHALGAPSLGGLVVAKAARCPLVWSVHEVFGSRAEQRVFATLLKRAQVRVACSRFVAQQFRDGDFHVVHSGTDVSAETRPVGSASRTTVICVGRLNRWKGQDALLRAYARVPLELRERSQLRIVGGPFVGDPSVADELRALIAELQLDGQVEMLGERADAQALMGQADLVVVPSQKPEPFGMVVIEGMALGRGVIATTPGGPAEVISDGQDGLLVPVGDEAALTRALHRLMDDLAETKRLGERARVTALAYTGATAADGYHRLYAEVLG